MLTPLQLKCSQKDWIIAYHLRKDIFKMYTKLFLPFFKLFLCVKRVFLSTFFFFNFKGGGEFIHQSTFFLKIIF